MVIVLIMMVIKEDGDTIHAFYKIQPVPSLMRE